MKCCIKVPSWVAADAAGDTFSERRWTALVESPDSTSRGVEGLHVYLALHQHARRIHFVFGAIRPFEFASDAQVLVIEPASGPVTQSPPANTPGSPVSSVSGSAVSVPHFVMSSPRRSPNAPTSGNWPMVTARINLKRRHLDASNAKPGDLVGKNAPILLCGGKPSKF